MWNSTNHCIGSEDKTYLGGKMVFRICWLLFFAWSNFSFEGGGEGRTLTYSNAYFVLHIVLFA